MKLMQRMVSSVIMAGGTHIHGPFSGCQAAPPSPAYCPNWASAAARPAPGSARLGEDGGADGKGPHLGQQRGDGVGQHVLVDQPAVLGAQRSATPAQLLLRTASTCPRTNNAVVGQLQPNPMMRDYVDDAPSLRARR